MFKTICCLSMVFFLAVGCGKDKKKPAAPVVPVNNEEKVTTTRLSGRNLLRGDVVRDQNGIYSIEKVYSFHLDKVTKLKTGTLIASNICGTPTALFNLFEKKSEEPLDSASVIGLGEANFNMQFFPGDYYLHAYVSLQEECVKKGFTYEFVILEN